MYLTDEVRLRHFSIPANTLFPKKLDMLYKTTVINFHENFHENFNNNIELSV
jgi:hypothetical protein